MTTSSEASNDGSATPEERESRAEATLPGDSHQQVEEEPYSIFSKWKRTEILTLATMAGFLSPMTANILKSASSIREAAIANINTGAGTAAVDLPEGGNAPAATTTNAKGKKSAKNAQAEATARKDAITRKSGATDLIAVDMVGLGFVRSYGAKCGDKLTLGYAGSTRLGVGEDAR